jgi:Uma2 family endonuclease
MSTKIEATIADLYQVEGKAELINGEIVQLSPTGGLPNFAASEIHVSLCEYARGVKKGLAVADNTAFIVNLPHRRSFSPDAAHYLGEITMKFFEGASVFAVEVRSEGDYGGKAEHVMAAKRADYFAAGTAVVWNLDLLGSDVIRKYRDDDPDQPGDLSAGRSGKRRAGRAWMDDGG